MLSLNALLGRSDVDLFERDLLEFPEGDNNTDTAIDGVHFNLTTLEHWNYTLYSNETLSNGTKCYLTFGPYLQALRLENNGTWVNGTKCAAAVDPIGARGYTGIAMGVLFGISLVCILTALTKHGKLYIKNERRFYPISRRWQWYWGSFVCAMALVGLFINVDVDRYRIQELPLTVTVFFYYLLCMGTMALVWEAVRHWGVWQERQYVDPDPFIVSDDDRRAKIEFYLPLWFYFWLWLNFFLIIPRSWGFVSKQRYPEQVTDVAAPAATDGRFRAAAFCLVICWVSTLYSLRHSIKHYKPRNRGILNRSWGFISATPLRIALIMLLSLGTITYQAYISFDFNFSVIKYDGPVAIIYGWGYGPSLAILIIQIAYGWASPNEDLELIRQRRARGEMLDRELGIVHKPAWWRRVRGDHLLSFKDKLSRQVHEVGGSRGTGRRTMGEMETHIRADGLQNARDDDVEDIEMSPMVPPDPNNPRIDRAGAKTRTTSIATHGRTASKSSAADESGLGLFPPKTPDPDQQRRLNYLMGEGPPSPEDQVRSGLTRPDPADQERQRRLAYLMEDGPAEPPAYSDHERRASRQTAPRQNSTSTMASLSGQPQQVRSMLDI